MQALDSMATTFFRVFGITQPTEKARRQASWFLLLVLVAVAVGLIGAGWLLYHLMRA